MQREFNRLPGRVGVELTAHNQPAELCQESRQVFASQPTFMFHARTIITKGKATDILTASPANSSRERHGRRGVAVIPAPLNQPHGHIESIAHVGRRLGRQAAGSQ